MKQMGLLKTIKVSYFLLLNMNVVGQIITTFAGGGSVLGNGGPAINAGLMSPIGVAADGVGNVYIAESGNDIIRKVDFSGIISTFAGNGSTGFSGDGGPAVSARLYSPDDVAVDAAGNVYIADAVNQRIRKVSASGIITTFAGTGISGYNGDGGPATGAQLTGANALTVDAAGNVYIADGSRIRKVDVAGIITTVAGDGNGGYGGDGGLAINAQIAFPWGLAVDIAGNLYIADNNNNRIRKVDTNGIISTIAGTGVSGYSGDSAAAVNAQIWWPWGIDVSASGEVYFSDARNNRVRKIDGSGIITTIAGTGIGGYSGDNGLATNAQLYFPTGIRFDGLGNLYICDNIYSVVRKINCDTIPDLSFSQSQGLICAGETVTLTGSGAASYTWNPGNIISQIVAVSPTVTTTYIIQVSTLRGCGARAQVTITVDDCTSLDFHSGAEAKINIFPNPASDRLFVETTGILPTNKTAPALKIIDAFGREIQQVILNSNSETEINISGYTAGLYLINIISGNKTIKVKRLVIVK